MKKTLYFLFHKNIKQKYLDLDLDLEVNLQGPYGAIRR